jgi:hypothetical protein
VELGVSIFRAEERRDEDGDADFSGTLVSLYLTTRLYISESIKVKIPAYYRP